MFNLKRISYILFAGIFALLTLGITINKHYSGGKLFSVTIFSEPESCCNGVCQSCEVESETIQFLANYTFSNETFKLDMVEMDLIASANVMFNVAASEPYLSTSELFYQDLPPPNYFNSTSFLQSYLL